MEKGTTYLMKEFTGPKNLTQHGLDPVEVKFIYSEKATKFYEIFTLLLTGLNWHYIRQKYGGDFTKFYGLLRIMNFTLGGGGGEEKEASSSQGPQNTQLLPNVKPVPLYSLVIDFFTHITYSLFLNILLFKFLIFHCRVVHSTIFTND